MKTLTFILVLMATSVGCLRFKQYPCEGFCIPGSMDSVTTFTSMQCARRCLKNNDCGWFLYQEELHQCIIDGTSCCTGWKAYYSGKNAPQFNNTQVIHPSTPANSLSPYYSLTSYGITGTNRQHLVLDIKGCRDAHIGLSKTEMDLINMRPTYEIVIGGSGNTLTYIRQNNLSKAQGAGVIDCDKYSTFWVTWDNDVISFGLGHELNKSTSFSWSDPNSPLDIKFVGVGTYQTNIDYLIYV